ncbi:sulfurtransferase [Salinibacterium sp. UTAS2018]|uniref:sulfurtransferase n=1 Tax=Salinibacterium sp. UTAS2018 TaxID=2508880 RepID=UPI0010096023|nr:sulfurtransferase [Salinibacterium sp. UTAS2018]QAV71424.1 sulfurtransferase [Salinibacterium sp. UTAS2018]
MPHPLVTANELAALLDDAANGGAPVRVLDVRWSLGGPAGRPLYEEGHIPSAVYVDLDTELARHGEPEEGRHPLPTVDAFQAAVRRWGINDGDTVVVYDDWNSLAACRAWWLLRYMGIENVQVLDGALSAWTAAGHPLAIGADDMTAVEPGTAALSAGNEPALSADDAAALAETGVLLDARAGERYRGEVEPIDPRAGHIPGAISAPTSGNLGEDGQFLDSEALRERYEALGVSVDRAVGVYCGSGVTAAHDALALTVAGFRPALFPGSWSAWSNQPERPVATGATP